MPGVYVSYPFCNQKCSFCNFASGVGTEDARGKYVQALCHEVQAHVWAWEPETLYLGGGTPSLMDEAALRSVVEAIPRGTIHEATMECAPGTVFRDLVRIWRELGINRVSLGVQSFVERELKPMGRRHTRATVFSDVAILREMGIENFNVDLIAGLPYQTDESWNETLDCLAQLDAPHVSVYLFEKDEDSRLGKELLNGGWRYGAAQAPDDDAAALLYRKACKRLTELGCLRYEISNFSRPGFASAHNMKYWNREAYVGFGLDAHSFDGAERWGNPVELDRYLSAIERGLRPSRGAVDAEEERFFVGLRLECGIEPTAKERARFARPIEKWRGERYLLDDGVRLKLSDDGLLVSNEILQDFIDA